MQLPMQKIDGKYHITDPIQFIGWTIVRILDYDSEKDSFTLMIRNNVNNGTRIVCSSALLTPSEILEDDKKASAFYRAFLRGHQYRRLVTSWGRQAIRLLYWCPLQKAL